MKRFLTMLSACLLFALMQRESNVYRISFIITIAKM